MKPWRNLAPAVALMFASGAVMANELSCVLPPGADAAATFVCNTVRAQIPDDLHQPLALVFLTAQSGDLSAHMRIGDTDGPVLGLHVMDDALMTEEKLRAFAAALLKSLG